MKWFNIVHHDGAIRVRIDDAGHAVLEVDKVSDQEVVIRAINQAVREGARSGTLFTMDVVHDQLARMHRMRAETGTTWLGGKVTQLDDGPYGPQFRIDWEAFPQITE